MRGQADDHLVGGVAGRLAFGEAERLADLGVAQADGPPGAGGGGVGQPLQQPGGGGQGCSAFDREAAAAGEGQQGVAGDAGEGFHPAVMQHRQAGAGARHAFEIAGLAGAQAGEQEAQQEEAADHAASRWRRRSPRWRSSPSSMIELAM